MTKSFLIRGNNSKLNEDQIQWLRQRIEQGPRPEDKVCIFHAADIQRIIKKQFGISFHVRSVHRLLKRLGYSYVSSRPEHPKGDPEKPATKDDIHRKFFELTRGILSELNRNKLISSIDSLDQLPDLISIVQSIEV